MYLTSERLDFSKLKEYASACRQAGKECVLVLPYVFRLDARNYFTERLELLKDAGLDAVVIKDIDELGFLKASGWDIPLIADHSLYSWNREARGFWKSQGILRDTLPLELNSRELSRLGCGESELVAYGYLPLMTTAGCLHKTVERCDRRPVRRTLADRYQKNFRWQITAGSAITSSTTVNRSLFYTAGRRSCGCLRTACDSASLWRAGRRRAGSLRISCRSSAGAARPGSRRADIRKDI